MSRNRPFNRVVLTAVALCIAAAVAGAQSHEVTIDGVRLWYRVAGSTVSGIPPVVFLHGGPGYNSYSFAALEGPRLERWLRMVYFDERGSGRSERPGSGDYRLATLVEDIEGLRRALAAPRVNLIGHSFGGILALEYAAKYPTRVSHLVLVSAPSDMQATCRIHRQRLAEAYPEAYRKAMADTALMRSVKSDCEFEFRVLTQSEFDHFNASGMFPDSTVQERQDSLDAASGLRNTGEIGAAIMDSLLQYRFAEYSRLAMPVLVIAGRLDYAVGLAPQRALAAALPHATFLEYAQSGHFPYLDEPDRFARDVVAFLPSDH